MNPRTTLAMAIATAALGAFLWFYEIGGETARREADEAGKRLFAGIEAEAIDSVSLVTPAGVDVRIERSEGGWRVRSPVDFPADPVALDGIASAIAQLTDEQKIDPPQPLAVYGIGDAAKDGAPQAGRALRFTAGGQERGLRIGRATPVGGNTYVARLGDDSVFGVPTWRINALSKELDDLRDRRVLSFDREGVVRVAASWPGGRVVLARDEDVWRMVEPVEAAASGQTVDDLLSDLAYLRADGFVDDPLADSEAGLDPPDFELVVELQPEAAQARTLHFAIGAERDGRRLARAAQPGTLYVLPPERIDDFPRDVVRYRDRLLARFASSEARVIELAFATLEGTTEGLRIERDDGEWHSQPALRSGVGADIVSHLSNLEAEGIDADRLGDAERAALGLLPPRVTLRVLGAAPEGAEAGALLAEIWLGELDAQRGIAAMKPGSDVVYRLEARLAENLPISWEALESRFLAPPEPAPEPAAPEPAASGSESGD